MPGASWHDILALILYTPLGVIIAAFRVLLHLLCATVYVGCSCIWNAQELDALATGLIALAAAGAGMRVRLRPRDGQSLAETRRQLRHARILVCNHRTQFDALFLRLEAGCRLAVPVRETYAKNGWLLRQLTEMVLLPIWVPTPAAATGTSTDREARQGRADVLAAMRIHLARSDAASSAGPGKEGHEEGRVGSSCPPCTPSQPKLPRPSRAPSPRAPLLVFPEGSITTGAGLMRFARGAFSCNNPVQPVTLRVQCPLPLAHDTVKSSLLNNYLRTLLQPWLHVELVLLPVLSPAGGEDPEAFAQRVAHAVARELGVPATMHSTADKAELLRRLRAGWRLPARGDSGGRVVALSAT